MEKKYIIKADHLTTWSLIKMYWQGDQRFTAYLYLSIAIIMTIGLVGINVALNYWYNFFYNALQAYDKIKTIQLLGVFLVIATVAIVVAVYRFYLVQVFGLRWRRWLTHQFLNRWLAKRSYYLLENFDEQTDNPDQRLQEDVNGLCNASLDLFLGLIGAVTTIFAFIYVLWRLSGVLTIPLGAFGTLHIPGYLVWVSVLYAGVGTFLTFKLGHPLIKLNFNQQRKEASFRYAAIDLRTHAENIALYQGEHHQRSVINRFFEYALSNWYQIILRQRLLLWFTSGYAQLAVFLPLIVAMPNYFNKVFLLGGLIQSLQAFGQVQDSMSYLVNAYTRIAEWKAVAKRLTTFNNHIISADQRAAEDNKVSFQEHHDNSILVKDLNVQTPQQTFLLKNINQVFKSGHGYLIQGRSGIGKSTFVRTLAGIWPYAQGNITLPLDKKIMFLPQKPYMPIGTLSDAILFPDHVNPALKNRLEEVLTDCRLAFLIPRLHETAVWSDQLSPGEQQRVAFARVLLHEPNWIFLDESTSMLDLNNETHLYQLLRAKLPTATIVSVGHRPSLHDLHDEVVDMTVYSSQEDERLAKVVQ